MGNVLHASSPKPPLDIPVFLSPAEKSDDNVESATVNNSQIPHPGVMEDLHKRAREVFPSNFEGARVMVNKGLSSHFQISHTINLGASATSGYRFGATYVGSQQTAPNESYPILLGDIDASGNLNATMLHQIERTKLKMGCQLSQYGNASQFQADYRGDLYSASAVMANVNILNESGVIIGQYLRSITKQVSLGAEIYYHFGSQIPNKQLALLSLAGRYESENSTAAATIGTHAVRLSFYQKASQQLQLGCELDANLMAGEAVAGFGYQIDLPKAELVFRGMINSNWEIGGVLEKRLAAPFTFTISGNLNHSRQTFKLGAGFVVG